MQRGEPPPETALSDSLSICYEVFESEALEAQRLVELRDRWPNPPEWAEWVDEPVPSYRRT
ncbi:MAG: hypothetical protein F4W89_17220 [Acidobacteria bacterium]|nr:hypothetical protein [Acidobacteriota bacterium]